MLVRIKKQGVNIFFQGVKITHSANFSNLKNSADNLFLDDSEFKTTIYKTNSKEYCNKLGILQSGKQVCELNIARMESQFGCTADQSAWCMVSTNTPREVASRRGRSVKI